MIGRGKVAARRAIEGLRAGVPNGEAIRRLGGMADAIEARFEAAMSPIFAAPEPGIVVAGGFGTGKSHLLGYLREVALLHDFVVSTVAVSKETPLSIPGVTFAAAMRDAAARGSNDDPVALALARVQQKPGSVQQLELWASTPESGLSPIFAALLHLLNRTTDPQLLRALEAFLAGGKPPLPAIRRALKEAGARSLFDLGRVAPSELVRQRLHFMPQLFRAAGFAGWVVLLDEVELIGRYGPMQRALAYVELAQWLGLDKALRVPGVFGVAAISDDFANVVINARQDDEKLTERLRLRNWPEKADQALDAMRAIQAATRLRAPDEEDLRRHEQTIRTCYEEAYDWTAEPAAIGERRANRTLRHHIRGWIMQWDMLRVAHVHARAVETTLAQDYSENDSLTETPEGFDDPA